tara:strand:+ start:1056 stop:1838 length:783 start_codon:yes stop_codon:yes gene_type:complete
MSDSLRIGVREFQSRLMVGTGKYANDQQAIDAIRESGADIVTMAIRRVNLGQNKDEGNILELISPNEFTILPNTAGCYTADESVRTCKLARELLGGHSLVKLEVIGDKNTLLPDMPETLKAAKDLVKEGFEIMVYCTDDYDYAVALEDAGCVAVMPLAAPIGSGRGIENPQAIEAIVKKIEVPVIVDAGIGTASDATLAMELGCDGVLLNSAIAGAQHPVLMATAMRQAVKAGRSAYLAGRMPKSDEASASSPIEGVINS